ncbi:MAG: hypothetical protein IPK80_30155 [Nannocystis sp.]|nr:hypothetical protein [Nannocystis sp.]
MSTAHRSSTLLIVACALAACEPPWHPLHQWEESETSTENSTSSGELTGLVTGTSSETTSDTSSGSASESAGETGDETTEAATGEPIEPPTILDVELTPNPIVFNGPIAVTVNAAQTEGVRMTLTDGAEVELDAADEPGVFAGEIAVTSGFLNGSHLALLTPWAGEGEGEAVEASYTIALPTPGSELYWETGDLIGAGQVAAMAVLPDGSILELGQRLVDGKSRCYLRQRDKGGGWKQDELVEILPAMDCLAVDIKVSPSGSIFVLAKRVLNNEIRWWLGEIETWGASPVHRGLGEKNQNAAALAVHGSGMVAVCGDTPTQQLDAKDAAAWLVRPKLPGEAWTFDHVGEDFVKNKFAESTQDCAFAGDTLVMVGEARGKHDKGKEQFFDRHFLLRFDTTTMTAGWTVAGGQVDLQSGATTVVVDDQGRYITGGYVCGDPCDKPMMELRAYNPSGALFWKTQIASVTNKNWGPHDLVWSPASYAVIALGGTMGGEFAFSVRAYSTAQLDPLWTYSRKDNQYIQMAYALAVGLFGEVYAGGFAMNGYPAVAYIAG